MQPWRHTHTKATVPQVAADTWHPAQEFILISFYLMYISIAICVQQLLPSEKTEEEHLLDATEEQEELYVYVYI